MDGVLIRKLIESISENVRSHSTKILVGTVLLVVLRKLFQIFIYPYYFSPLRHLPEPPQDGTFPWYHAQAFRETSNGAALREWVTAPNNGLMRIRVFMNQERLFITSPEALREVLVTNSYDFVKPRKSNWLFRTLLGNGILAADGMDHKAQRKALLPAFSYRHIKDLYTLFWEKAQKSARAIAKESSAPVKVYDWASRTTLDIIGVAGMGWDFNTIENPDADIAKTYKLLFENEPPHFRWGYLGLPEPPLWTFYLPLPVLQKARSASNRIREVAHERVKKKEKNGNDILSIAARSGQFSDEQLVDQMMTFAAAGHETTASALTYTMYQMCAYPEIQKRLREEIRTGMEEANDVDKLPYLNAVCNEVLRCIPSVPGTHRVALKDSNIHGQFVPKGTRVYITAWATNVDPKLWGEDVSFDPDRWLRNASGGAETNYANLTFVHGPRSCIGKDFAKAELKFLVAAWVGRFKVSWVKEPMEMDPIGYVTVRPRHRLPVRFEDLGTW